MFSEEEHERRLERALAIQDGKPLTYSQMDTAEREEYEAQTLRKEREHTSTSKQEVFEDEDGDLDD